jgi:hypothetical protein
MNGGLTVVIAGPDPAIHRLDERFVSMDGRVKPGHDGGERLDSCSPSSA